MTYAIAAAGTGGHVFPALAVGQALVRRGLEPNDVLFIGGDRLEKTVFPAAGFSLLSVDIRGLDRRWSLRNLSLPATVMRAVRFIAGEIERRKVGALLGVGGYATLPAAWAAKRLGIPVIVHEQNAVAGLANRVAARFAARVFGSFPSTQRLPTAEWVGNPLRIALSNFDRASLLSAARSRYGLQGDRLVVGFMGGSLGAGILNQAADEVAANWSGPPIDLVQIAGPNQEAQSIDTPSVNRRIIQFEERIELFYAVTDLVVARAGGAVAEFTATATPSILVPGRFGSAGHQLANAEVLAREGAALLIYEPEVAGLSRALSEILADAEKRRAMAAACRGLAKPNAADEVAAALEDCHV